MLCSLVVILQGAVNDPETRSVTHASTHGHSTAAALAKIYGIVANGGSFKGRKLLSQRTIQDMITPGMQSKDIIFNVNTTYGAGLHIVPNQKVSIKITD